VATFSNPLKLLLDSFNFTCEREREGEREKRGERREVRRERGREGFLLF